MAHSGIDRGGLKYDLVDLLDGGAGAPGSASRSSAAAGSSWHTAGHPSGVLVQLGDDGVADPLYLLLLVLELVNLGELVGIEPLDDLVAFGIDGLYIRV